MDRMCIIVVVLPDNSSFPHLDERRELLKVCKTRQARANVRARQASFV
jgi:hypothetical protein